MEGVHLVPLDDLPLVRRPLLPIPRNEYTIFYDCLALSTRNIRSQWEHRGVLPGLQSRSDDRLPSEDVRLVRALDTLE